MSSPDSQLRRCLVYRDGGEPLARSFVTDRPDAVPEQVTIADRVGLRSLASHDVICCERDLALPAILQLVLEHRIGCLPVVDDRRRPIGVITKLDVVERLESWLTSFGDGAAMPGELAETTAADIMMPLVVTLDEHATVAHAAAMMSLENVHHVLVTSDTGALAGIVSSKDLVDWLARNDGLVPEPVRFASGTVPPPLELGHLPSPNG